jgi:hypothetical protein
MASFLTHIALGGVVGAAGALTGGLMLVALRIFLNRTARSQQLERIRQIGIIAVTKQALFDERNPELPFPPIRQRQTAR